MLTQFILIFCAVVSSISFAESSIRVPYLYQVSKEGRISWLFGTFHYGIDFIEVRDIVKPYIVSARSVYVEAVIPPERMKLWDDDPAQAVLTSEYYEWQWTGPELTQATKELLRTKFDLPDKLIKAMRSYSCDQLFDYYTGKLRLPVMDYGFMNLAGALGKELRPLDSPEVERMAAQAESRTLGPHCDLNRLVKIADPDILIPPPQYSELYRSGAAEPGIDFSNKGGVALRNRAWLDELLPELKNGGVFAAFGTGHLYGAAGLIELLQRQGFTVQRLSLDGLPIKIGEHGKE